MTHTAGTSEPQAFLKFWQSSRFFDSVALAMICVYAVLAVLDILYGGYASDEGFYAIISRQVWKGRALYGDIRFTQMPLEPYFYGFFMQFMPQRIESGRVISIILTGSGSFALWRTMRLRTSPALAALGLFVLLANPTFLAYATSMMTYALTFAGAAWGLYFLALAERSADSRSTNTYLLVSGLFFGAALLTRLSILPLNILALASAFWIFRKQDLRHRLRAAGLVSLGSLIVPALVCAGYFFAFRQQFLFGVFEYHAQVADYYKQASAMLNIFIRETISWAPTWAVVVVAAAILADHFVVAI